jgi:pimeloyl-ACP methyl ester carboxylesterase
VLPENIVVAGASFHLEHINRVALPSAPHLIWAHGWGQNLEALRPIAESFATRATSTLIDFPGFGQSPLPPSAWSTAEYADAVADILSKLPSSRRIWIGHSFGCRVGIQLAARHPGVVDALCLIAAAGLPRRRSLAASARVWLKRRFFQIVKFLVPEGPRRDAWRARLGSADYRSAGSLRPILVKVVSEDLSETAGHVQCPVLLLYGSLDTETPVEIGERLIKLMPNATLSVLDGFDHYSILTTGRHQLAQRIVKFLQEVAP